MNDATTERLQPEDAEVTRVTRSSGDVCDKKLH